MSATDDDFFFIVAAAPASAAAPPSLPAPERRAGISRDATQQLQRAARKDCGPCRPCRSRKRVRKSKVNLGVFFLFSAEKKEKSLSNQISYFRLLLSRPFCLSPSPTNNTTRSLQTARPCCRATECTAPSARLRNQQHNPGALLARALSFSVSLPSSHRLRLLLVVASGGLLQHSAPRP